MTQHQPCRAQFGLAIPNILPNLAVPDTCPDTCPDIFPDKEREKDASGRSGKRERCSVTDTFGSLQFVVPRSAEPQTGLEKCHK